MNKSNWKEWLIAILLICLTVSIFTCTKIKDGCETIVASSDTVYKTDTFYKEQKTVTLPSYIPIVRKEKLDQSKIKHKEDLNRDVWDSLCQNIQDSFYTVREYNDSVALKDSVGKDVGVVKIEEKVTENKLIDRIISYKLKFPIVTNTITITNNLEKPPKTHYYIGAEVLGNGDDIVNGASINFLLQNKKNTIYGISIGGQSWNSTVKPEFGFSIYKRL